MTLPEFLLARYAEDREWTETIIEISQSKVGSLDHKDYADMMSLAITLMSDPRVPALIERWEKSGVKPPNDVKRVLAECEVKRRIVELEVAEATSEMWDVQFSPDSSDVLRLLALPYINHPDYREEWKP